MQGTPCTQDARYQVPCSHRLVDEGALPQEFDHSAFGVTAGAGGAVRHYGRQQDLAFRRHALEVWFVTVVTDLMGIWPV